MHSSQSSQPKVFAYLDYRKFLHDVFQFHREHYGMTVRAFVKKSGFKTTSVLSYIIKGETDISGESVKKLSKAFDLSVEEANFFSLLVDFDQSKNLEGKEKALQLITRNRNFKKFYRLPASHAQLFSNWKVVMILEAIGSFARGLNTKAIADRLKVQISETKKILETLQDLGCCEMINEGWQKKRSFLQLELLEKNALLEKFHRSMIDKALENLERPDGSDRLFVSLTLPVSAASQAQIEKRLLEALKEIQADFGKPKSAQKLLQVNLQLFPLQA